MELLFGDANRGALLRVIARLVPSTCRQLGGRVSRGRGLGVGEGRLRSSIESPNRETVPQRSVPRRPRRDLDWTGNLPNTRMPLDNAGQGRV